MVYRAIPVVLPEQAFLLLVSRERERRGLQKGAKDGGSDELRTNQTGCNIWLLPSIAPTSTKPQRSEPTNC